LELDRRDVLRFVEPETGEVALLRPDITPQIARIVATRLSDRPAPWRLCYHGTMLRRRRGRARKSRALSQAGVECVGFGGLGADLEVIGLAAEACALVGLPGVRVELGQVGLGRLLLAEVPEAARAPVAEALASKDAHALEARLREAKVPARQRRRVLGLVDLYGERPVLGRARRRYKDAESRAALDELARVWDGLAERGLEPQLGVDLGELRGHAYYTGVSFALLAEGPGEPLGGGGRYDRLLGRFGRPAPATGFGLDVGHVLWALEAAGRPWRPSRPLRLAELGAPAELVAGLRDAGVEVAALPESVGDRALGFARAWGYDGVLGAGELRRASDGKRRALEDGVGGVLALRDWLAEAHAPKGAKG
ncbi:MAG TPA: ATP phosphoribosyltransferase regulatory subunit, partial [Polyangiaceae bacterium LLY-WYZ-15_(1-7)]|nr:ATP phosphoribosyltransferase regulatory subunit [Polyangiaceae bacterium LLY-WYZ-15_(1-7)]